MGAAVSEKILNWEIGIQKLPNYMDLLDLQGGGLEKWLRGLMRAERAEKRAQRADKRRRGEKDYSDTSRRSGRNGLTRAKDKYHSRRVIEPYSKIGTGIDESDPSWWRMNTDGFHLIVVSELKNRIVELQTQQGIDWPEFKKALKEEYFFEDSQRVTKQSFMKWINQKNKGLSARELLREFEKKYEQLSSTEQRSIKSKWVELFVQATDARLQKSLVLLLEDVTRELGLTSDWKLVPEAINMIVKCQMRVDKMIVFDSSDISDEESKDKPTSSKHKLKEPILDDLVKGIQELNLNLKAVKLEGLGSKSFTSKGGYVV
ncbi:hypothetical protein L7F22_005398 [Adiantum nelumboides]|nr:hypothetical protein [Adiantum nelumboides]